jgi:uncharacterized protein (DUF305 family)
MEKKMLENVSLKTKLKHLFIGSCLLIAPVIINEIKGQTPIVFKTISLSPEDLRRPMNSMMDKVYNIKMTGNFDKDYVAIMKEFQQGGIDLCKVYEMSGEDPKLLEHARVSAVELKENQKQLKGFYSKDGTTTSGRSEHHDLMFTLNRMMKEVNAKGHSGNLNTDYVTIMVAYNWANTQMAKAELAYGRNAELKNRAAEIIEEFSCHDNDLIDWLNKSSVAEK